MDLRQRKPLDQGIDVFGTTDIGKSRSENQDQFLICALQKHVEVWGTSLTDKERLARLASDRMGFLALVADGVGGSAGGKEASQTAVESVLDYVTHSMQCFYTRDPNHEEDFLEALHEADLPPRAVPHPMLVPAPVEGREGRASSGTRATA